MAPRIIFIGSLARETIIDTENKIHSDFPGGDILYMAYAAKLAGSECGLAAKVGENFPVEWINTIQSDGINVEGIDRLPIELEQRQFYRSNPRRGIETEQPQKHFLEIGLPMPRSLLGYDTTRQLAVSLKKVQETSITPPDLPNSYKNIMNMAISTRDFATLSMLHSFFKSSLNKNIFYKIPDGFFKPGSLAEFSPLLHSAKILFTNETNLKSLLINKKHSVLDTIKVLCSYGLEMVVFYSDESQIKIYISNQQQTYTIPIFSFEKKDLAGCFDAFIGGFLGKYIRIFDPVVSAAYGSSIMGIKLLGTSPAFLKDTFPELVEVRAQQALNSITSE